jgi:hypothetical protein
MENIEVMENETVAVKKGRGRPKKGKGRPKGSNTTTITDPLLEPYKINIDANCYTITDIQEVNVEKAYGYFTNLGSALRKIVKLQMVNNNQYTLESYIKEFENKLKQFTEKFNI